MEPVSPIMLLRDLSRDRSNWTDVRHYPDTVTLRRMIRLCRLRRAESDALAGDPAQT